MTQINSAIAVLTFKGADHIISVGGTCSWALNRSHALKYEYAVCTRNQNTRAAEGSEPHGSAFLIGRISDVVPSPERPDRWLIKFSEYARVSIPSVWGKGWRNPVRYTDLESLGISIEGATFHPMPEPEEVEEVAGSPAYTATPEEDEDSQPLKLTIAEAKEGLSANFGVPVEAIEIIIKG